MLISRYAFDTEKLLVFAQREEREFAENTVLAEIIE